MSKEKPELSACPCGDKAAVLDVGGRFRVYCNNSRCFIGPSRETEAEAIAAWNRRYVCPDKNGKPVYAGEWFNFLSDRDPPVKLRFVWVQKTLRYMIENEEGSLYFPAPKDKIELIQEQDHEG